MTVKRHSHIAVDSCVNNSEPVTFSILDRDIVVASRPIGCFIGAIYEQIIRWCGGTYSLDCIDSERIHLPSSAIVPFCQRIWTKIHIVVGGCWAFEDYRAEDAVSVLCLRFVSSKST